jgi:AraC family transcriptional regulator, regulatory protein of adaptative response / methylated-DNA-[protein]-cysteine methyltransferase
MNLMITEITQQPAREKTGTNASIETVSYSASGSILGEVLVARSVKGVCAILLGDDRDEFKADLAIRFPEVNFVSIEAFVRADLAQVIRFLDNPSDGLRLPLDMRGTPLQRRVWEKLRAIPVGRTVTYTEVAYWVGPLRPRAWSLALAPPIRSLWPFLATASFAARAILGAIAGESSASVN